MYEGSSIDCGSHKQATEQKGEESDRAGCVEKKELLSCQQTLQCVQAVQRKGDHPEALFTIPCFPSTQQHNSLAWHRRLGVYIRPAELQGLTKALLHHHNTYNPAPTLHLYNGVLNRKALTISQGPAEHLSPEEIGGREAEYVMTFAGPCFLLLLLEEAGG